MSEVHSRPVAIVTGGSRNIGRAIARALAAGGASIVIVARSDKEAAEAVVRELEAAGVEASFVLADVARESSADIIVDHALQRFGRLDILVNNAAIRREKPVEAMSFAEWHEILGICLDGAFLLSRAAIPHLSAAPAGAIINIGGLTAYTGAPNRAHVVAAKAGLDGLTKALAVELAPRGITVNLVSPGRIGTDRSHAGAEKNPAHHARNVTLSGKEGTAEDVAAMVAYLAGPAARFVTGQTVHVNGGAFLP
ncbi:SDR family NAD(P)-dependent oxidoreductase [Ancylobacter sp.]|uniref:SDR family NAD(P)-dependent oxidoreductase n=1 Tax=Ancylobacter sp. TaxID=1872567 RepID=UPI003D14764D